MQKEYKTEDLTIEGRRSPLLGTTLILIRCR